jgi:hypothetical protein
MSVHATYAEGLPRGQSASVVSALKRVLDVFKLLHEVWVEAQDMARESHRRYPHLD